MKIYGFLFFLAFLFVSYIRIGKAMYQFYAWAWRTAAQRSKILLWLCFPYSCTDGSIGSKNNNDHPVADNTDNAHDAKVALFVYAFFWPLLLAYSFVATPLLLLWRAAWGILEFEVPTPAYVKNVVKTTFAKSDEYATLISKKAALIVEKENLSQKLIEIEVQLEEISPKPEAPYR
jgi:hypothetical protein